MDMTAHNYYIVLKDRPFILLGLVLVIYFTFCWLVFSRVKNQWFNSFCFSFRDQNRGIKCCSVIAPDFSSMHFMMCLTYRQVQCLVGFIQKMASKLSVIAVFHQTTNYSHLAIIQANYILPLCYLFTNNVPLTTVKPNEHLCFCRTYLIKDK